MFDIAHPHDKLVSAAYAEATWKKILSAFNAFRKFCIDSDNNPSFPVSGKTLGHFINWATFDKNLNPSTVSAYISHRLEVLKICSFTRNATDKPKK